MEFTAGEINALLNGNLVGNASAKVSSIAPIEEAKAGSLSFVSNPKYAKYLSTTKASVVLVDNKTDLPESSATFIKLEDVYTAFSTLLQQVEKMNSVQKSGIEKPSFISDTALIGKEVYIGAFAYIGENCRVEDGAKIFPHSYIGDNSVIGKNTVIHAGVKCYPNSVIGRSVIIHSGAVIGSDGFGFAPQTDGSYVKMPQTGNVEIEDHVEIGANTTIDRATIKSTIVRQGAKLDNLIQVAHNVIIGKNTAIAAQAGISGSTKIGENCLIGGQAGIVGHIEIADKSKIGAKAGVGKSIKVVDEAWSGRPAIRHLESLKVQASLKQLPDILKRLRSLEEKI